MTADWSEERGDWSLVLSNSCNLRMAETEKKKLEAKLYQLLLELLDTERTYVADLVKVSGEIY